MDEPKLAPLTENELKKLNEARQNVLTTLMDLAQREAGNPSGVDKGKFHYYFIYQTFYFAETLKQEAREMMDKLIGLDVKEMLDINKGKFAEKKAVGEE